MQQNFKVTVSGVDTYNLPVISSKKMDMLFKRMLEGDQGARELIVKGNLRLVLSVLKGFKNRGENLDDLFQIGCIGLLKAVDNFNPELGVKFSTYAVPMIMGEIRRYLRDNNTIRVSRSVRKIAHKALQQREKLAKELGREPTIKELATHLDLPEEEIVFALDANYEPISLNEPVFNDNQDPVYIEEQVKDNDGDESWLQTILLKEALEKLSPREKEILFKRFFAGKTQVEVAKEIGISQAQVSRLEKVALDFIKNYIR
ncbi:RNA polymerase, sigma subunit, RpsG/SigG [Anaerobranca californiensis DSM 14826]|uniref:RNA polymerase sigma factor n=1 Tax=Anaerobranca californiensis DSM 14826 TaxID=1120989 RepID=A0A1M6M907_9FIRM|nr:RNA polymerase sporulation sigma factor SigG [Anaerobranca californiensis]SHJ79914.1 RNA polymerase, sigma subunit, RpsG/SigG [Anaerobranca californiensis DSM 14826]